MPQPCQVSQRRFLWDQSCSSRFRSMLSTDASPRRPPIPVSCTNWTPCCRNRWSAWPGMGGRHPPESMVGIARIMHSICLLSLPVLLVLYDRNLDLVTRAFPVMIMLLPYFMFEALIGPWLIVKGFNSSAIASQSAKTEMNELE